MGATSSTSQADLESRLRSVGRDLAEDFAVLMASALGAAPQKPGQLVDELGLDKTLASKLMRGLKAEEPLRGLFELPAPKGLGIAADAAATKGAASKALAAARARIDELADLQASFPGGRAGLLAVLSGWLPETREKEDRQARQASFRAMSTITGTRIDAIHNAYLYAPSPDDPERCDTAWVVARYGLRRLRLGSSIRVTSLVADGGGLDRAVRLTLDGAPLGNAPDRLLLPEFCSDPLPDLRVEERLDRFDLVLGKNSPPLDGSTDLALGSMSRGLVPRYRSEGRSWEYTMQTAVRPAVVMVADLLVHRELFGGRPPIVTSHLGLADPDLRGPHHEQADVVDQPIDMKDLGTGLSRLGSSDLPRARELLGHAFSSLGWDPEEFRAYRVRVPYPAPSVTLALWLELPERPAD